MTKIVVRHIDHDEAANHKKSIDAETTDAIADDIKPLREKPSLDQWPKRMVEYHKRSGEPTQCLNMMVARHPSHGAASHRKSQ